MNFFGRSRQILGMNARNLYYVAQNSSRAKKFADDKIYTKNFLSSRGIGVAKLFHVVKQHTQLTPEFFDALPAKFVIKPNRGFAGGGIHVMVGKKGKSWLKISGEKMTQEEMYRHCIEILDGKYSISGVRDSVIFEEVLATHPDFLHLTEVGLPDVRVIVYNRVPVMAMLRVPTHESDGKANMELGAYGLGIDLSTGRTTGGAYHSKYIKKLKNGESAVGFQIPHWEEILISAARIQHSTQIGYLGIDFVITKSGVKVLELNARAGLKIQVANRTPLKPRLRKVGDLNIATPEDGAAIAHRLFASTVSVESMLPDKPVIGIREYIVINLDEPENVLARVDLGAEKNTISEKFADRVGTLLDVTIGTQRLKLPVQVGDTGEEDVVLAGKFLGDFLIDVNKKVVQVATPIATDVDARKLRNVDERLAEIDEQIKLLSVLNPRNLTEQRELFLANPDFVPRFSYREIELDTNRLRRELRRLPAVDHVLMPLFQRKINETAAKLDLIDARETKDFQAASERVYQKVSEMWYRSAVNFLKTHVDHPADTSTILDAKTAGEVVGAYLKTHHLGHWAIKLVDESVADMQITKRGSVLIKKHATFSENRLQALLVHEIGTHVFRFENGRRQPFQIFARGTAGYLQTEEGMAVHNQNMLGLELGEKFLTPALLVVAIFMAQRMGFRDLFDFLHNTYEISDELAWKLCVKAKRGTIHNKPGTFTKDAIYFLGWQDVQRFLEKGGEFSDLYGGKYAIKDLKLLEKFGGMVDPKWLV